MLKKISLVTVFIIVAVSAFAQHERLNQIADSIKKEGKALYRSEWASWYGTDIFEARCPEKKVLSGGYFSYETPDNLVNIFFSKGENPFVLASIYFARDFNSNNYRLDTARRKFTANELSYYTIRTAAKKRAKIDTSFKYYKNTSLNIIPIINGDLKKVYALTGPNLNGIVIFGADYMLTFNSNNEITSVNTLHRNIIPIYNKKDTGNVTTTGTMHTHTPQTGDFITATDICTLMLYEKIAKWQTHYILSKNYVSIWDCKKDDLLF